MKVNLTNSDPSMGERQQHVTKISQRNMSSRYPNPGTQVNQLTALRTEFDSMEESLRDALRHNNRQHYPNPGFENGTSGVCENTITKRHNYITVYEQEPVREQGNFRNVPNLTENQRHMTRQAFSPSPIARFASNQEPIRTPPTDEFQRYCSALVNRIQKMEEQNVELTRMAEQQQHAYQKAVAQVVESEKSQRLLVSECHSLREQVQQLANHNKELKEKHLLKIKPRAASDSTPNVSSSKMSQSRSNADRNQKEALKHLHGNTASLLDQYDSADVASIVELYAALQRATLTDFENPDDELKNRSFPSPHLNQVSHSKSKVNRKNPKNSDTVFEDPDYASPSSICTAPSCTRCLVRSNSDSHVLGSQVHHHHNHLVTQEAVEDPRETLNSQSTCHSVQSFDNNSYLEVELKPGKNFQISPNEFRSNRESNTSLSFDRNRKSSHSHNHYENAFVNQNSTSYSSNENLQKQESVLPFSQSYDSYRGLKSFQSIPNRSPKSGAVFPTSGPTNHNPILTQQADQRNKLTNDSSKNSKQYQSKQSPTTSSSTPDIDNFRRQNSSFKMKKYSRSASTSELPPPPPPPPTSAEPDWKEVSQSNGSLQLSRSRLRDNSETGKVLKSIRENNAEKQEDKWIQREGFPTALSLWKDREKLQSRFNTSDNQTEEESTAGWRRGSYSRACRKSQSFDHLYEMLLNEEQKSNFVSQSGPRDRNVIETRVNHLISTNDKTSERRSPTFVIQESASTLSPYEMMLPVDRLKRQNASGLSRQPVKNSDSVSPSITSQRSRLNKKVAVQQNPTKPSTTSEELDSVFGSTTPSIPDDTVFLPSPESGRNRRFSEGTTGNRQKDKVLIEADQSKLRRNRSIGAGSSSKKQNHVSNQQPSHRDQHVSTQSFPLQGSEMSTRNNFQQPKCSSRSPHNKTSISSAGKVTNKNKTQQSDKLKSQSNIASKLLSQNNSCQADSVQFDPNKSPIKHVPQQSVSRSPGQISREQSGVKMTKKNKDNNIVSSEAKKKTASNNNQSKSFVNLMKAKFTRSSVRAPNAEKQETKALSAFLVTPASSLIDPRTLSLEPNTFLSTPKDNKKVSKQILGENSDAAVGRKLSQPFPNRLVENTSQLIQLSKLSEETLPDEGFAEGSSLERPLIQAPIGNPTCSKSKPVVSNVVSKAPVTDRRTPGERGSFRTKQNFQRQNSGSYKNSSQKPNDKNASKLSHTTHVTSYAFSPSQFKHTSSPSYTSLNGNSHENVGLFPSKSISKPVDFITSSPQLSTSHSQTNLLSSSNKDNHERSSPTRQNEAESAFITSHVQSELRLRKPFNKNKEVQFAQDHVMEQKILDLSFSSGSVGTGTTSSFGSLPSDAIENGDSNIVLTSSSIETSSGSYEATDTDKQHRKTRDKTSSNKSEINFYPNNQFLLTKISPSPAAKNAIKSRSSRCSDETASKKSDFDSCEKSVLKIMKSPTKKSQIIFRPSKIATVSKLAQPTNVAELRGNEKRVQQEKSSPLGKNSMRNKSKFASPQSSKVSYAKAQLFERTSPARDPVYENCVVRKPKT